MFDASNPRNGTLEPEESDGSLKYRAARRADVGAVVELLADDDLGARRERVESPTPQPYFDAFEAIADDENNELVLATLDDEIVGVMQLTFIPSLTHQGSWRAQIEGVRVASEYRSRGVGRRMFEWAIHQAHRRGCLMVQLTTDKTRPEALRFYESLGFKASHEGMKLCLETDQGAAKL